MNIFVKSVKIFADGGGTTPYEAHLERKRAALRRALKTEFIRQRYHPNFSVGADGAFINIKFKLLLIIQRTFLTNTMGDHKTETTKSSLLYSFCNVVHLC